MQSMTQKKFGEDIGHDTVDAYHKVAGVAKKGVKDVKTGIAVTKKVAEITHELLDPSPNDCIKMNESNIILKEMGRIHDFKTIISVAESAYGMYYVSKEGNMVDEIAEAAKWIDKVKKDFEGKKTWDDKMA